MSGYEALRVELGAGNSTLDVGELDLTALDVAAGAGNINVDLTGDKERDFGAVIRGGVIGKVFVDSPTCWTRFLAQQ